MWSMCSAADCEARFAAGTAQRLVSEDSGAPPSIAAAPAPTPDDFGIYCRFDYAANRFAYKCQGTERYSGLAATLTFDAPR